MPSEVSCNGPRPVAIVSKVVRADAGTTEPLWRNREPKRRSRLADVNSAANIATEGETKGRVWLAQELRCVIAEIELDLQLAM